MVTAGLEGSHEAMLLKEKASSSTKSNDSTSFLEP